MFTLLHSLQQWVWRWLAADWSPDANTQHKSRSLDWADGNVSTAGRTALFEESPKQET